MLHSRLLYFVLLIGFIVNAVAIGVPSVFDALFSSSKVNEEAEQLANARKNSVVPMDEFTTIRIEYIKNQILKKLRLKEKPTISRGDLPKPVIAYGHLLPSDQDMDSQTYSEDFYGKTMQAIIFPFQDNARCLTTYRYPAACVPFQMPNDIHVSEVSNAELWFRKDQHLMDSHNQTFVVSEVAHWDTNKSFKKSTPVAIQETSLTEDWVRVDVTHVVKNWLDFYDSPVHAFSIVCKTCIMDEFRSPVTSTPADNRPFLVIYTHIQQQRTLRHKRQRRSAVCGGDVNECCKESLYVSFAEIGWGDWIIRPEGYNAYFCKGSCLSPSAITLSGSQHHTILHKMMYGKNSNDGGGRPELTPCCAATQFQPLQLVYMDSNKTVTTKLLSNMIVETCGCM